MKCTRTDSARFELCTQCGQTGHIARRIGEQRVCSRCYRLPIATCSRCGKARPCFWASTDSPECKSCKQDPRVPEPCAVCGKVRRVRRRRDDGSALCDGCGSRIETCAGCGNRRRVGHRLPTGKALCRMCYEKRPEARKSCTECGVLERLHRHGLCNRCASRRLLAELLSPDGKMQPHTVPVFEALLAADAAGILAWLKRPGPREVLRAIGAAPQLVTHDYLNGLRPPKSVAHIRAGLVANGVLPPRDERMVALQNWIAAELTRLNSAEYVRVVRSFATWHHLRRLRQKLGDEHMTLGQVVGVRRDVKAAVDLLNWLSDRQVALHECSKDDIEGWLTEGPSTRYFARTFLSWSTKKRHAPKELKIPILPNDSAMPLIETDERWSIVRRLLHDEDIHAMDRVAGLLILLYAQPLSRIVQISVDQISTSGGTLKLGEAPVSLPPPLDALIKELRDHRRAHTLLGHADVPWLFPGGRAGGPLDATSLMRRLQAYGIRARPARNTTLMDLANQLPAVVISRLLGLHIDTATRWSAEAGNTRADYAAQLVAQPNRPSTAADPDAPA